MSQKPDSKPPSAFDLLIAEAKQKDYRQVVILNWVYQARKLPAYAAFLLPRQPASDLQEIQKLAEDEHSDSILLLHHFSANYPCHDFLAHDDKTVLPAKLTPSEYYFELTGPAIMDAEFCRQGHMLVTAYIRHEVGPPMTLKYDEKLTEAHTILAQLHEPDMAAQIKVGMPEGYPQNKYQIRFAKAAYMEHALK